MTTPREFPIKVANGVSITAIRSTVTGREYTLAEWEADPTALVEVAVSYEGAPAARAIEWHQGMGTAEVGYEPRLRVRVLRYRIANPLDGQEFAAALQPGLPEWATFAQFPDEATMLRDIWLAAVPVPEALAAPAPSADGFTAMAITRG